MAASTRDDHRLTVQEDSAGILYRGEEAYSVDVRGSMYRVYTEDR